MRRYAIERNLLNQPQRLLISNFKLEKGIMCDPLPDFHFSLGLKCTEMYRFGQYSPQKCFNSFVQSVLHGKKY